MATTKNPSNIEVLIPEYDSDSVRSESEFTGEIKPIKQNSIKLHCFYNRTDSDIVRSKYGVSEEVTLVVFVSPIELEKKTGSTRFSERIMRNKQLVKVKFNGNEYFVQNILYKEEFPDANETMAIAIQLNLMEEESVRKV